MSNKPGRFVVVGQWSEPQAWWIQMENVGHANTGYIYASNDRDLVVEVCNRLNAVMRLIPDAAGTEGTEQ